MTKRRVYITSHDVRSGFYFTSELFYGVKFVVGSSIFVENLLEYKYLREFTPLYTVPMPGYERYVEFVQDFHSLVFYNKSMLLYDYSLPLASVERVETCPAVPTYFNLNIEKIKKYKLYNNYRDLVDSYLRRMFSVYQVSTLIILYMLYKMRDMFNIYVSECTVNMNDLVIYYSDVDYFKIFMSLLYSNAEVEMNVKYSREKLRDMFLRACDDISQLLEKYDLPSDNVKNVVVNVLAPLF